MIGTRHIANHLLFNGSVNDPVTGSAGFVLLGNDLADRRLLALDANHANQGGSCRIVVLGVFGLLAMKASQRVKTGG
ncbi:hypothetical protein FNU76_19295 [Chitinimonas arctica]|uniref:Uncharacterized protein n=1 Tax=Chitinimonas arctica TaxID=2594795 RepID=A0A516SJL1_9NEIS|nr:hypothetical protein FNU76_19295 [Chitinimonas arctica]